MGDETIAYFQRAPTGMVQGWECFEHNGEETCVSEDNVFAFCCVCVTFVLMVADEETGKRGNEVSEEREKIRYLLCSIFL